MLGLGYFPDSQVIKHLIKNNEKFAAQVMFMKYYDLNL